jgi:hypothetical protein
MRANLGAISGLRFVRDTRRQFDARDVRASTTFSTTALAAFAVAPTAIAATAITATAITATSIASWLSRRQRDLVR